MRDPLVGLGIQEIEIVAGGYIIYKEALNPLVVNTIKKVWKTEIGMRDLNTGER